MNRQEARTKWQRDYPVLRAQGFVAEYAQQYVPSEFAEGAGERSLRQLALDSVYGATGPLSTDPNSTIPAMLTSSIDPVRCCASCSCTG